MENGTYVHKYTYIWWVSSVALFISFITYLVYPIKMLNIPENIAHNFTFIFQASYVFEIVLLTFKYIKTVVASATWKSLWSKLILLP